MIVSGAKRKRRKPSGPLLKGRSPLLGKGRRGFLSRKRIRENNWELRRGLSRIKKGGDVVMFARRNKSENVGWRGKWRHATGIQLLLNRER